MFQFLPLHLHIVLLIPDKGSPTIESLLRVQITAFCACSARDKNGVGIGQSAGSECRQEGGHVPGVESAVPCIHIQSTCTMYSSSVSDQLASIGTLWTPVGCHVSFGLDIV